MEKGFAVLFKGATIDGVTFERRFYRRNNFKCDESAKSPYLFRTREGAEVLIRSIGRINGLPSSLFEVVEVPVVDLKNSPVVTTHRES